MWLLSPCTLPTIISVGGTTASRAVDSGRECRLNVVELGRFVQTGNGLTMNRLQPSESQLTGHWIENDGQVIGDDVCQRIEWLVDSQLKQLAVDSSGWDTLLCDPSDGRLWERTYRQSEMHGGGPPQLKVISAEAARNKYGV